jgi:dihydrofolate synthase/folylpolyglutamate synthase
MAITTDSGGTPVSGNAGRAWASVSTMEQLRERLQVDLFQARAALFREGEGFARSVAFMGLLGSPQDAMAVVHVAGTAGKGTVAYEIEAGLRALGLRTGLHVSPHVYDLRERWQLDGALPSESATVELFNTVAPAIRDLTATEHGQPTFYEVTLGMAFTLFARSSLDVAVVETGLGGLYDTTNTVTRRDKIAVITRIDFDHESVLGPDLGSIARQKAGILPRDGVAFAAEPLDPVVRSVLDEEAAALGCRLTYTTTSPADGAARHVGENLALSTAVVSEVARRREIDVADPFVLEAALSAKPPGRFEQYSGPGGRLAVLDGAHNPVKLAALIDRLETDLGGGGVAWVFGCRRDKKMREMVATLAGRGEPLYFTQFEVAAGDVPADVSVPAAELATAARASLATGLVADAPAVEEAVERAIAAQRRVVVTGSFGLLARARATLLAAGWSAGGPAGGPAGWSAGGPTGS